MREDRSLRSAWQKVLQAGNAEEAATKAAGLIAAAERVVVVGVGVVVVVVGVVVVVVVVGVVVGVCCCNDSIVFL